MFTQLPPTIPEYDRWPIAWNPDDPSVLQVFATGYKFSFPFLASNVIPVSQNKTSLYKYVFPPELDRPTLAIIGLVQPLGAIMPISEMQARWATRVFKGNTGSAKKKKKTSKNVQLVQSFYENIISLKGCIKLPSMDSMLKDIKCKEQTMAKR